MIRIQWIFISFNSLKQPPLTHMRDWLGTVMIEPDALGRALKVTDQHGSTVGYEWDGAGRRLKTLYPDGGEVGYTYDDGGRLSGVTADGGLTTYSYDRLGRLMGRVSPDGTVTGYVTDAQGRLTMLSHEKDGVILDRFSYGHDSTGNITSVDKQRMGLDADSGLFTYGYDKLDRLVSVGHGGSERVYLYDGFGNRVASVDNGVVTGYTYDSANRLTAMEAGGVKHGYGYDGRGNLSEVTSDGVVTARYTFDATNRLTEAVTGVGTAKYGYNGMLARVMKTEEVDGLVRETRHTLDMTLSYDNLLMEDDGRERSFVWGNGLIAATGGDSDSDSNSNMFFFHDHLGSPVRLTGSVGDTEHGVPMAYDEFGGRLHGTDRFGQPFGFTGYQDEDVTGLYYAQARYYEPRVSRIVSPDLWAGVQNNPQSLHKYTYCYNNPLRYVDRDGLSPETVPNPTSFPTPLPTFTPRAGIDAIIWSSSSSQTPTPTSSPSPTLFPAAGIDAVLWGGSTLPSPIRDVTVEINNALQIIITEASERVPTPFQPHPYVSASVSHVQHQRIIIETGVNMMWFYEQVNHRADWDIKREAPWNRTIGTEFPGSFDTQVIYNGKVVTPEYLGNYTYGYIGAALGLPLWMLKGGSWYADGFSLPFGIRGDWANEYGDWYDIAVGFNAYHNNVCEE